MPRTDLPSPSSGCTNRPTDPPRKFRLHAPPQDWQRCIKKRGVTSTQTVCTNRPVRILSLVNRTFSHSRSRRVAPYRASWSDKVVPRLLTSAWPHTPGERFVLLTLNSTIDIYSYSRRCWANKSSSASQEIPNILRTQKFHHHVHSSPLPVTLLRHINPLTHNDHYSGRTAPLTSKVAFYIFIQQI